MYEGILDHLPPRDRAEAEAHFKVIDRITALEIDCRRRAFEDYVVAPGWEWFADQLRRILQGSP